MQTPPDLGAAIATEPLWLQLWVMALVVTHLLSVVFLMTRLDGQFKVRYESLAILVSFLLAGFLMNVLYAEVGYVRLLGVPHLVFWTPAFIWICYRRSTIGYATWFGRYIDLYIGIAGTSLVIDVIDVCRYLLGDGQMG